MKYQFPESERRHRQKVEEFIREVCREENINIKEFRARSRRRRISLLRSHIASKLLEAYGIPLAEIARQLGVSTSAISKALKKGPRDRE